VLSLDLTYQTTCRLDATPKTTVSKTWLNLSIPLFIYTRHVTNLEQYTVQ